MKLLSDGDTRRFFGWTALVLVSIFLLAEAALWRVCHGFSPEILVVFLLLAAGLLGVSTAFLRRRERVLEEAASRIEAFLDGDTDQRIDCDQEGQLYRLFHLVNTLATTLNAHAANEQREKVFLKNTISDISHQLKTPLAALNIYNGLLQSEQALDPELRELTDLSEQELDRMETLVQGMLKITRLDAGSIVFEKAREDVADMMRDIALSFSYRASREGKKLELSGEDGVTLFCDREWLEEAVSNLVKNALDHTGPGDTVRVEWTRFPNLVRLRVADTGRGIHPEDLHHIFKRFYRSRFSQDTQGLGLGLPLAKAIIEGHNGVIEVESFLGRGSVFTLSFLDPTKL